MKVLITGAKGNLGLQLQKAFSDCEVAAWDSEELDITDREEVIKKISLIKPDVVINAAAYNAVDKCEEDELEYELAKKINGYAAGYLADAALENNACLIHYSTDFVFGAEGNGKYAENAKPAPLNKYGESKLSGEKEIIKRGQAGLKYYIIRTSKLFGPRGESAVAKPSFFDIMLKLSREKETLDVVDDEKSCFTYTCDLASATKVLIDEGYENGIYHITNSEPATWYEAVNALFDLSGVKAKINPVSGNKLVRPAKRPGSSVLVNTKFKTLRSYKEALEEYLKA